MMKCVDLIEKGKRNEDWYKNQLLIFAVFEHIQKYSKDLTKMILASQIDTGQFGKNVSELIQFLNNYSSVQEIGSFMKPSKLFTSTFL